MIFMNFNKVIELSQIIENNMPYYPGDPEPKITDYKSIQKDMFNIKTLHIGTHTGTHVDAPAHYLKEGEHINELGILSYSGKGVVINAEGKIEVDAVSIDKTVKDKVVLFFTGTNKSWKTGWKMNEFSYLSVQAAEMLVKYKAKAVGIDSPSVEPPNFTNGQVHKTLLSHNILIIENLSNNVKELVNKKFYLLCLPLLIKDGDGAPSRVIAAIE